MSDTPKFIPGAAPLHGILPDGGSSTAAQSVAARIHQAIGRNIRQPHKKSGSALWEQVSDLEAQRDGAMHLLGEIIATLTMPTNKGKLLTWEHGESFLQIAHSWAVRLAALESLLPKDEPSPTGEATK